MAKFKGIFDIEGTLQGMTFYRSKDGLMVRTKGGVSKERIMNDPTFERTRENGQEFAHCAKAAQFFRNSILEKIDLAKDHRTHSRMIRLMHELKKLDESSPRGERKVHVALQQPGSEALFVGFDCNQASKLGQLLPAAYTLDTADGTLVYNGPAPGKHLRFPPAATEADLQLIAVRLDFETENSILSDSPKINVQAGGAASDLNLAVSNVPAGDGVLLYLVLIEFFQMLNGVRYPLKNRQFNALSVIAAV